MMKRLDVTTFEEIDKIVRGQFEAGVRNYGLEAGGIGLSEMKFTRHLIPDPVYARLQSIREAIIAGEIDVAP
jgi:basic membrane protein A